MPLTVLISGAGIAGSTLAFLLAKTGARITVVEKAKSLLPHGQNVDIQGSALLAVAKMGLMDQVLAANTSEKGSQFVDAKGNPVALFPMREDSAVSLTSQFEILRGDLAKILYEAAEVHPNVNYLFDTTIRDVISNDDDAVKVVFSDGSVQTFDLLVAADGQWSKVRKECFAPESIAVIDTGMYATYWTVPRLPTDNDWWNIYLALKSRIITTRPDPHNTTRAMFTYMPRTEAQKDTWRKASRGDRKTQQKHLEETFGDAGWQAQRLLEAMDGAPDFYFHTIQQIKMLKWFNSRVICLGDAAYAPTPLTGAGTSLAILGGYVLAGELSELREAETPTRALQAYENKFRPFIEKRQHIPPFLPGIAHPETAWKRWMLHAVAWIASKIVASPWLPVKFGDEFDDEGFPLPIYSVFESVTVR